jgi:hypothetical protein
MEHIKKPISRTAMNAVLSLVPLFTGSAKIMFRAIAAPRISDRA